MDPVDHTTLAPDLLDSEASLDPRPGTKQYHSELPTGIERSVPLEPVGTGVTATVVRVLDRKVGRPLAMTTSRQPISTEQHRAQLLAEARVTALLEHPVVAKAFDWGNARQADVGDTRVGEGSARCRQAHPPEGRPPRAVLDCRQRQPPQPSYRALFCRRSQGGPLCLWHAGHGGTRDAMLPGVGARRAGRALSRRQRQQHEPTPFRLCGRMDGKPASRRRHRWHPHSDFYRMTVDRHSAAPHGVWSC